MLHYLASGLVPWGIRLGLWRSPMQLTAILIPLVFLLLVVSVVWLSIWLVKRFRARTGLRVYLLPLGVIIVIAGVLYLPSWFDRPNSGPPQVIPGADVQALIDSFPDNPHFGYAGLGYFKGKLYVATNVGLAEIANGEVVRLFRFQNKYSVVSGPWIDRINQILWVLDDQTFELLSFDGSGWKRLPMPRPQQGYFTRGEVLEGVRAVSGPIDFAFSAGDNAWKWNSQKHAWVALSTPPAEAGGGYSAVVGILPMRSNIFLVRHESLPFLITDQQNFQSDTAVIWNGTWSEIPNHTGLHFFADEWTVADAFAYICTQRGELLRVSIDDISLVHGLGQCESLAVTDAGNLLVSFRKMGIYDLTSNWKQRAAPLYPSDAGEYWTHIAAQGDEIAYSIEGKPVVNREKSDGANMTFTSNAPTHLWLIKDGKDPQLLLPQRP